MSNVLRNLAGLVMICFALVGSARAQTAAPLTFATVHRPPFAIFHETGVEGFSIDLMQAIASDLDKPLHFLKQPAFGDMLDGVRRAQVDGAIANISITASREIEMDFSQPIFESGLQILLPAEAGSVRRLGSVLAQEILVLGLLALALLFGGGFLMWLFERRHQAYFDRPMREAMFPSFWWALNLVVNGGFEERMPMSRMGRIFAVFLVISSLFVVSIFVATITAAVTVDAIQSNVDSVNDLEGRQVATVAGSTSAEFLSRRDIAFRDFPDPEVMLRAFERGEVDAVVFDGPILAYYVMGRGKRHARLIDRVYRPENYGIALPTGSAIREEIDQALLRLREDGTYDDLVDRWFGTTYRN